MEAIATVVGVILTCVVAVGKVTSDFKDESERNSVERQEIIGELKLISYRLDQLEKKLDNT